MKGVEAEYGVLLEISRDRSLISILGLEEDVREAANKVLTMIEERSIVEEKVRMSRPVLVNCFLCAGTYTLRKQDASIDRSVL